MKTLLSVLVSTLCILSGSATAESAIPIQISTSSLSRRQTVVNNKVCFTSTGSVPSFCLQASIVNGTTAQFAVYGSSSAYYYGFGPGTGMSDADIYLLWVYSGQIVLSDRSSTSRSNPTTDAGQNLVLSASLSSINADGSFVAVFTRPLAAPEATVDKTLANTTSSFIAAIGSNPNSLDASAAISYHSFRTTVSINPFLYPVNATDTPSTDVDPSASSSPSPSPAVSPSPAASSATTGKNSTSGTCFSGAPASLCVSAKTSGTNTIITVNVGSKNMYAAIGIGKTMSSADIWMMWVTPAGDIALSDRYSLSQVTPIVDSSQDLTIDTTKSVVNSDGSYTVVFSRITTATDTKDLSLANKAMDFVWAMGTAPTSEDPTTTSISYHGTNRGTASFNIFQASGTTTASISAANITIFRIVHGVSMFASWSLFIPIAIAVARYGKNSMGVWWFRIHVILATAAIFTTLGSFGLIVAQFYLAGTTHFKDPHHLMGLGTTALCVIQGILGIISDKLWVPSRTEIPWWDKAHWWLGRLTGLLAAATMGYALVVYTYLISMPYMIAFFAWTGVIILVFVILEFTVGPSQHIEASKDAFTMSTTKINGPAEYSHSPATPYANGGGFSGKTSIGVARVPERPANPYGSYRKDYGYETQPPVGGDNYGNNSYGTASVGYGDSFSSNSSYGTRTTPAGYNNAPNNAPPSYNTGYSAPAGNGYEPPARNGFKPPVHPVYRY